MGKDYQVRCWDCFYNDWACLPISGLTREQAIEIALENAMFDDCGEFGTQEEQVYVRCLGLGEWQMVGYVELQDDGFVFVESFG